MFFQKRYEAVSGFPVGQGPVGRGDGHSGTGTAQAVGQDVARLFGPDEQNFRGPGKVGYEAACQRFGTVLGRYQVCPQSVGAEGLCRGTSDDAQPDTSQGPAVFLKFTEAAEETVDAVTAGKKQPVIGGQMVNGLIEDGVVVRWFVQADGRDFDARCAEFFQPDGACA